MLCVGASVLETSSLRCAGFVNALPFAAQVSAPAPYGAFHDLRWLLVYANSWTALAGGLALLVLLRGTFDALSARLAWPSERPTPTLRSMMVRGWISASVSVVVLSPWAAFAFAAGLTSLSWFVVGMFIPLFATFVVFPQGAMTKGWWRRLPPWRAMALSALTFWVLSIGSLALTYAPGWVVVPVAAAVGAFNAWAWTALAATLDTSAAPRRPLPVGAGLVLLVFLGSLFGVTREMGAIQTVKDQGVPAMGQAPAGSPAGTPLILVAGFGSRFSGRTQAPFGSRYYTERFSYRGLGPNQQPLPYAPTATYRSIGSSARLLAQQVAALHAETGKTVDMVAESEGTVIVREYLARYPHPPVSHVVLSSPLLEPSRVSIPFGNHQGFGLAAAWLARQLLSLARAEGAPVSIKVDSPFIRSFVTDAGLLRSSMLCPVRGVHIDEFVPLAGAAVGPPALASHVPLTVLPAFHAEILNGGTVRRHIARDLAGSPLPRHPGWRLAFEVARGAANAWEVPALPLSWFSPADARLPDPAFGDNGCANGVG